MTDDEADAAARMLGMALLLTGAMLLVAALVAAWMVL